ncbi:kinase-like protein [Exidia glandulosa HHB12029]|uniref:non-specific serine/threonine protein kinase n=1 Tax=Exidia glandulosa HHB12029 TaxID=1314781 RepID=A0A165L2G9_EXIGL|nr:kinase-like protein [Exidia glandulosa HHB12029]
MQQLPDLDRSNLSESQVFAFDLAMKDIKNAVQAIPRTKTGARVTTFRDMLTTCFADGVKDDIESLRKALHLGDGCAIAVSTLPVPAFLPLTKVQKFGRVCQTHHDQVVQQRKAVQLWLPRQYVLWALGIDDIDTTTGEAATKLTSWLGKMEDAIKRYRSLELPEGDTGIATDEKSLPRQPAPSGPHPLKPRPKSFPDHLPKKSSAEGKKNVPKKHVHWQAPSETFNDLTGSMSSVETKPLAHGAFSSVFKGVITDRDGKPQVVALKVIHIHDKSDLDVKKANKRVRRELYLWSTLSHRNILPILGTSELPHALCPAFVSPWCEHGSLTSYIAWWSDQHSGSPVISIVLDLLEQLLDVLRYLQERTKPVVHGDLKGENIFVNKNGSLKLCDFGLARMVGFIGSVNLESSTVNAGTLSFMSPERLASDDAPPTIYFDMWSLSCVFVEMYTGRPPYHGPLPAIVMAIQRGGPARPRHLTNELWSLVSVNWERAVEQRLTPRTMLDRLRLLRQQNKSGESVPTK